MKKHVQDNVCLLYLHYLCSLRSNEWKSSAECWEIWEAACWESSLTHHWQWVKEAQLHLSKNQEYLWETLPDTRHSGIHHLLSLPIFCIGMIPFNREENQDDNQIIFDSISHQLCGKTLDFVKPSTVQFILVNIHYCPLHPDTREMSFVPTPNLQSYTAREWTGNSGKGDCENSQIFREHAFSDSE